MPELVQFRPDEVVCYEQLGGLLATTMVWLQWKVRSFATRLFGASAVGPIQDAVRRLGGADATALEPEELLMAAEQFELPLPSIDELSELPRRAAVAYATRCVRRVQPIFSLTRHIADHGTHKSAITTILTLAEQFCRNRPQQQLLGFAESTDLNDAIQAVCDAYDAAGEVAFSTIDVECLTTVVRPDEHTFVNRHAHSPCQMCSWLLPMNQQ